MVKENAVAFYVQVAETLKGRIETMHYKPGELIPSERELEKEFGVSNITIRKALDLLVRDGYIVRKRGIGTRVIHREEERIPLKITGNFYDWVNSAIKQKQRLDVDVLGMEEIACPSRIARILGYSSGQKIWRLRRIRKLSGEPLSYYINYVSVEWGKIIEKGDFKNRTFLEIFQKKTGNVIKRIEQRVEATTADMDTSAILDVEFGAPLFFVENIYSVAPKTPIEVTHIYFRGDRYIYYNVTEVEDS